MELEEELLERVGAFESLSQWEKSELGRDLRRDGLSYGEIMDLVPVKKSTLSTWCREIRLTSDQIASIKERRAPQPGIPRNTQRKRHREIALIRSQARLEAEHLIDEPLWVAGVALYWGEGFKTQSQLGMANSDPFVLRLFLKWVEVYLPPPSGFRARLNLHADNDEPTARHWWSGQLGIPLTSPRPTSSQMARVTERTISPMEYAWSPNADVPMRSTRPLAGSTSSRKRWAGSIAPGR